MIIDKLTIEIVTKQYCDTAIWADKPEGAISPRLCKRAIASAHADVTAFLNDPEVSASLTGYDGDVGQIGHDLWLTRNGHGAGFRDRDFYPDRDLLTDKARDMGERHLFHVGGGFYDIE